jgi:hypothetical protein
MVDWVNMENRLARRADCENFSTCTHDLRGLCSHRYGAGTPETGEIGNDNSVLGGAGYK